jgi:hypothetical protein
MTHNSKAAAMQRYHDHFYTAQYNAPREVSIYTINRRLSKDLNPNELSLLHALCRCARCRKSCVTFELSYRARKPPKFSLAC